MATISKEMMSFEGKKYDRIIKCDASGEFTCNLPPQVAEATGFAFVTAKTKHEVMSAATQAIDRYKFARTTTAKVILYEVKTHCYIKRGDRVVYKSDMGNEISFCSGTGVAVAAAVCTETKRTEADGAITYDYKEIESSLPYGMSLGFRVQQTYRERRRAVNCCRGHKSAKIFSRASATDSTP